MPNPFDFELIELESGYFDYNPTFEAVASFNQRVLLLLNTWRGEFVYDLGSGMDYKKALSETFNSRYLEGFFIKGLKQLDSFERVSEFQASFDLKAKTIYVSFLVISKDSEIAVIKDFKL